MSLFLDEKYILKVSHLLRNFTRKSDHQWNFSCPICGDSKKNKLKRRGYLYRGQDGLVYKCHNCGESMGFGRLLQGLDESAYKEYEVERFRESASGQPRKRDPKEESAVKVWKKIEYKPILPSVLEESCTPIIKLSDKHPARVYLEKRKIPRRLFQELFWTEDFPAVVDVVSPGHQFALRKEGRIIIPFLDRNHKLLAVQGRSLSSTGIRYITVKAFADAPRIYGMHRLAKTYRRIYAVEGPFDSMFLPNCIALAGSDIPAGFPRDKTVIVYDNERRKPDTVAKIAKAIENGYQVCIWPNSVGAVELTEKDINQMVLSGYTPARVRGIIDSNTYSGLEAKLKLQAWSNPKGHAQTTYNRYNHQL